MPRLKEGEIGSGSGRRVAGEARKPQCGMDCAETTHDGTACSYLTSSNPNFSGGQRAKLDSSAIAEPLHLARGISGRSAPCQPSPNPGQPSANTQHSIFTSRLTARDDLNRSLEQQQPLGLGPCTCRCPCGPHVHRGCPGRPAHPHVHYQQHQHQRLQVSQQHTRRLAPPPQCSGWWTGSSRMGARCMRRYSWWRQPHAACAGWWPRGPSFSQRWSRAWAWLSYQPSCG